MLKGKAIRYPNQVWSTDITYIRLPSGNVYLMAVIDWFSRKVLNWRVFNMMDAGQYAALLRETVEEYGIEISMDGTGQHTDRTALEEPQIRGYLP